MLGILSNEKIEEILKSQIVGRIGCHADGETYVVPISYAYDGQYIYCHTHEGKKASIMRKNPAVCFEVEDMHNMANWQSVVVQGIYEEIKGRHERNLSMQILLNRYLPIMSSITTHLGQHWPFQPDDTKDIDGLVFRIVIQSKSGRFEKAEQSPVIPG